MLNEPPGLPNTMAMVAPAKLNLFLRVLGRRADGYHEVETMILPISLADRLQIHAFADPGQFRTLSLSLDVIGPPSLIRQVPKDESNLALRAAMALAEGQTIRGFADIVLEKRVPAAAGLGGGSADAAAVLTALNHLWGCALSGQELRRLGATVGSDVPALLDGGPVLAGGRGEVVEPARVPSLRWVIVVFPFTVATADAFSWWDRDRRRGPDPASLVEAAARAEPRELGGMLYNDLEEPVMRRHPEVREARTRLLQAGAAGAVMCGSGPTMAGLVPAGRHLAVSGAIPVTSLGTAEPEGSA